MSNRLVPGLTNEISFSHLSVRSPAESRQTSVYSMPGQPDQVFLAIGEEQDKVKSLLLRDHISYRKNLGDWSLEPAVNFTFRSVRQTSAQRSENFLNNAPVSVSTANWRYEADSYVLTPSIGISYKTSFHITGGVAASLTDDTKPVGNGAFPFASVMLDLFRISNAGNPQSLKLFGSYSQAPNFADLYFSQPDASNDHGPSAGMNIGPVFGPGVLVPNPFPEDATRNSMQLGAVFATAGNKWQLSYHFENRRYVEPLLYESLTPLGIVWMVAWPDYTLTSHRLGIMAKVVEMAGFNWQSGLNVTTFKSKMITDQVFPQVLEIVSNNDKPNWTGGFTNRLQAGKFSVGLDIRYLLNEQRPLFWTGSGTTYERVNSWRLNNLYVAYSPQLQRTHPLELYLTARNSVQNDKPGFPGKPVRYFGAGFKLQI